MFLHETPSQCSQIYNNLCYTENIQNVFSSEIPTNLDSPLTSLQLIYTDWQENPDPDVFYSKFHNEIFCKSKLFFYIDYPLAGIAATKLCELN